jgi:putative ATP-dependent endonuclease of the OLD family
LIETIHMIIKSMNVRNFRSILDETLDFDNLTALVGANGSGKSSFLHSLELFQAKQPKISPDDFHNKNTENEIIFSITFTNLSDDAKTQFSKYVQNDELTVERVFTFTEGKISNTYHGSTLQSPDFLKFRSFTNATTAKPEYVTLKQKAEYTSFPNWTSFEQAKNTLNDWENAHPDKCERIRDDGQFFGFNDVALGYLGKHIKLLYIPAVRDASLDATEGKNSVLADLINIVIKNELMQKEEIQTLEKEFKAKYAQFLDADSLKEISTLSKSLTDTLNNYAPNTEIDLSWVAPKEFQIPFPSAIANLVEDGYSATVDRTGHGLQRVFIMTLLQYLTTINDKSSVGTEPSNFPTLVLIIEEPELYQHPNRQRHLSEICLALSECEVIGVTSKIQIVYSTHSPHFVGLDRINQIRLLKKMTHADGQPKITTISSTSILKLVEELSQYHGDKFTEANIVPRLHMIRTPWINEGFFSKCVVLVEGGSDRATILGAAKALKINLEGEGISVIPCFGKGNLDHIAIIFKQLKIPTYVIWDNDRGNDSAISKNKLLLKLFDEEESDFPSHVKSDHACIEGNLETMLKDEMGGDMYEDMLKINMTEYDLDKSDAIKNPTVLKTMLEDLENSGGEIPETLKQILRNVRELNQQ